MKRGPIIVVEDDPEDQELFRDAITELGISNPIIFLNNGESGLEFLRASTEQPFIIFCDINIPKMNGLELREQIDADEELRRKSIPFIFYTTSLNKAEINQAYNHTVQGYFKKEDSFELTKKTLKMILDYWDACKHPNSAFIL
jgi:CheY-like chemotaxis protein